jgi:hypothetical protein
MNTDTEDLDTDRQDFRNYEPLPSPPRKKNTGREQLVEGWRRLFIGNDQ